MVKVDTHSQFVVGSLDTSRSFFTRGARLEPPTDGFTRFIVLQDLIKGETALNTESLVRHRGLRHHVGNTFELFNITGGVGDRLLRNRMGARLALE